MASSKFKLGLFARTFILMFGLMLASLAIWVQVFLSIDLEPRAVQASHRISSAVSLAQLALDFSAPSQHAKLLTEIAAHDAIRIKPREPSDQATPVEHSDYWQRVTELVNAQLHKPTPLYWAMNNEPGLWVAFTADDAPYWLALEREHINDTSETEWVSWLTAAVLLSLFGSAIAVGYLNQPLNRLARNAQLLARGLSPKPLPEKGPREIKELNASFNRMVSDLQQAEADRNLMLAGISHDLRTPLSRMRLEVELSPMSQAQQNAIDEDLAQVNRTLDQLMDYARPASKLPQTALDVTPIVLELVQSAQKHLTYQVCQIHTTQLMPAKVRMAAQDLTRCVMNLLENAKHYGVPVNGACIIQIGVRIEHHRVLIDIQDNGPGIKTQDIARVLRPFSRGQRARTGGGGAGLGLAIVSRLLANAQGTLSLLAAPQGGLIARINLPLAD